MVAGIRQTTMSVTSPSLWLHLITVLLFVFGFILTIRRKAPAAAGIERMIPFGPLFFAVLMINQRFHKMQIITRTFLRGMVQEVFVTIGVTCRLRLLILHRHRFLDGLL